MASEAASATIDQLIISSPYEEPIEHWKYNRETRRFTREPGRRPAGYVRASEASKSFDDPGEFVELPLVNQIRPRVKAWREADYPGATGITKRLLKHWRDLEQRETSRRFFFCQLEAIETLMWLSGGSGVRPGWNQGSRRRRRVYPAVRQDGDGFGQDHPDGHADRLAGD